MNVKRQLHSGGRHYADNHEHVEARHPDDSVCWDCPITHEIQIASLSFGIIMLTLMVGVAIYCVASRRQIRERTNT